MTNLTAPLNDLLRKHNHHLRPAPRVHCAIADEFLREAYRINDHIASLHTYLLSVRQAYLSTTPPARRPRSQAANSNVLSNAPNRESLHLDTKSKDAVDASSKTLLRDSNATLSALATAEEVRQNSANRVLLHKYKQGVLGRWAAGASSGEKTSEQLVEEGVLETLKLWRGSVLEYLRLRLLAAGEMQREMMERRLGRDLERGRSVLYKVNETQGIKGLSMEKTDPRAQEGSTGTGSGYRGLRTATDTQSIRDVDQQLSPEQLQLFAQENEDLMNHYNDTLDQVKTAERSMIEISELQTTLVQNLDIQSANISQLVSDSLSTTENVGGGNKELKRATERKSTARVVFWASCGLCGFLVTWDLIF